MGMETRRIYTGCDKSKVYVRKSPQESCAWDSGSAIARVSKVLTRTRAGTQYPGFTWKKCHPHRIKSCPNRSSVQNLKNLYVELLKKQNHNSEG